MTHQGGSIFFGLDLWGIRTRHFVSESETKSGTSERSAEVRFSGRYPALSAKSKHHPCVQ